jgi:glycerophosphoryl diester phosphodiesterase
MMRPLFVVLLGLLVAIFALNTNLLTARSASAPTLLAHRGIAQQFDATDVRNDTCTAVRMLPSTHSYLENTLVSMRAAFDAGADIVEIDVHPTTDGQFAVFHDWTLECRTDGTGATREHTMAELKRLDVGYGYTADGGRTFPFRGKGIGLMPSLDEVLVTFPDRRFSINVKSRDITEGTKLAAMLARLPMKRRAQLIVYGGNEPIAEVKRLLPDMKTVSRASLKACLSRYTAYSWTGIVPQTCRNMAVLVPINIGPWLWGWPNRFLDRMDTVGSSVFVLGPYHGGEFSAGIDTPNDLKRLPAGFSGGIWTNEIEAISKALKSDGG